MSHIWQNHSYLFSGLLKTLSIATLTLIFSSIISILLGIVSIARFPISRRIIAIYIEMCRDTPLIVSVFMIFFMAPSVGLALSPFWSIVVALSLWGGANGTVIVRTALDAIGKHQWESAHALGLPFPHSLVLIVSPQAAPLMLPSFTSLLVLLVQATALGSLVGVEELFNSAQNIVEKTTLMAGVNVSFDAYVVILVVYFAICYPISYLGRRMERRLQQKKNG